MRDWLWIISAALFVAAFFGVAIYINVLTWNECRTTFSWLYCITRH